MNRVSHISFSLAAWMFLLMGHWCQATGTGSALINAGNRLKEELQQISRHNNYFTDTGDNPFGHQKQTRKAHYYRTHLPVFNVSGILSINSFEPDYCNRTYRMVMNEWFLEECQLGKCFNYIPCNKRASPEVILDQVSAPFAAGSRVDEPYDIDTELFDHSRNRRVSKRSGNNSRKIIAHKAQVIMEKCCKIDCSEKQVRTMLGDLCGPYEVKTKQVF